MYKQTKLKNNLKFISVPMKGTKTITILVMVGAGSKYENRGNNGISHFIEHIMFKGTKKRPNTLAISAELDSVGGEFNAFTSKEYTGYWVKVDSSKTALAVDVLSDILTNSKFDSKEINREKGVIIEEINMYHENPMMYVEDLFEKCLYGDSPSGWEIIGPKENILNFKRKDFIDYLNKNYSASNMTVCIGGDIKEGTDKLIQKNFSKIKDFETKGKEKVSENQTKPQLKLHYKKGDQVNLALGVRGFAIGHKDEFIARIIAIILGGSMSSRLFINLRERKGLAYYVRTSTEFYTDSGYLTTQAGVPTEKTEEAIKIILQEYKNLTKKLVYEKELQRTKDLIRGRSAIQMEASDNVSTWYGRQAILRDSILSPNDFFKKIDKVSAEDIRRVAGEIFIDRGVNLAVIGEFRDKKKFERLLNF